MTLRVCRIKPIFILTLLLESKNKLQINKSTRLKSKTYIYEILDLIMDLKHQWKQAS